MTEANYNGKPIEAFPILSLLRDGKKLKVLNGEAVTKLCREVRELITDVTLRNGGHLGSSLGTVELCVALLRTFDPERDKIIFDVGHQSYAYKILTDRLDRFHTLRKKGGISGFPRRAESKFDVFDTGHSSTSISAALGFAKARDIRGQGHEVIAVIGDGALLNGLALEALNNVASSESKLTVVLNDNNMSINAPVGGMAEHLAKISVSVPYKRLKQFIKEQCRRNPGGKGWEDRLGGIKDKLKSLLLPPNIFESMGITYWGPFDGHKTAELEEIFELSKQYPNPLLIHVVTQKGRGCPQAEARPSAFHGVSSGSVIDDETPPTPASDWSEAVAENLTELAGRDARIVACTAAMTVGTRLTGFQKKFPNRFFDVGIAEGHMLTFAAGLAAGGMRPAVCVYSTFLQRAMDQLVHDICMQRYPVLIAVDRAGLSGEDGETHQGLLDMSWGRAIPGLTICAPRDKLDLKFMMARWLEGTGPVLMRYPKGTTPECVARENSLSPAPWDKAEILRDGGGVCLIGIGSTVEIMLAASEELGAAATAVDLRFASPIDWETVDNLLSSHESVLVAEDGYMSCGVGEAIAARAAEKGYRCKVKIIGVRSGYIAHASRGEQLTDQGITVKGVMSAIRETEA